MRPPSGGTSRERNHPLKVMQREFQVSKASRLNYLLYVPESVQGNRDEKCPTILFLHGLGESGEDPSAVLRHGPTWQSIPIFPSLSLRRSVLGTHGGRSWRMGSINSFFTAEPLFPSIISGSI